MVHHSWVDYIYIISHLLLLQKVKCEGRASPTETSTFTAEVGVFETRTLTIPDTKTKNSSEFYIGSEGTQTVLRKN